MSGPFLFYAINSVCTVYQRGYRREIGRTSILNNYFVELNDAFVTTSQLNLLSTLSMLSIQITLGACVHMSQNIVFVKAHDVCNANL